VIRHLTYVIDRRLNERNKSAVNRQRFLRRYRDHIKKAVSEAVSKRSITDIESGENIGIPGRSINEPYFKHGAGGKRSVVHSGNKEFSAGDKIPRPKKGGGKGGSEASNNPDESMDEFVFQITQDEFLEFMFEDMELPNLVKKQLKDAESFRYISGGIVSEGVPAKINIIRSLRSAHSRRIALGGAKRQRVRDLEKQLEEEGEKDEILQDKALIQALMKEISELNARIKKIPYIDTYDLKYNHRIKESVPSSKAVMFCVMDVSGSMTQDTKNIAKRFFILLYLFLQRNYDRTEVVFIRHHTGAREVDEQEFFYSRETGGTIVSSALTLMNEIMEERYPASDWNVYGAQASDGDNWNDDSSKCKSILIDKIMPKTQYFSYLEITSRDHQALWHAYKCVEQQYPDSFAMQQIQSESEIFPVFRELFQRRELSSNS
jgi:uncharacterized sporulation protein YeaH/YhbH (DUF444 family)